MSSEEEMWCCRHAPGASEFAGADVREVFPRDRVFMPEHLSLELWFDMEERGIRGRAVHTFSAINDGLDSITLDAVDMRVLGVRADGKRLRHDHDGRHLKVRLPRKLKAGERASVRIEYEARPRTGMFFIRPDEAYPSKPHQVWTQGEMEDNRHWFPSYDYPNARVTSEVMLHVPEPYMGLSNGRLVSVRKEGGGMRLYHWRQEVPHVNYLITVVLGEFDVVEEECDGIPLVYYVPRGLGGMVPLSFRCTPAVTRFLNRFTGLKYPYERYAQVVVHDFTFGGMENTTLTVLYQGTLHDELAMPNYTSESLIAHEMAHQWFGDLLTMKSWAHLWLNEGFATYLAPLYFEDAYGKEEFQYRMHNVAQGYLNEAKKRYMRPIVTNRYTEPEDMFDAHSYQKGGCVLHMMRFVLGDELFLKSVRHYVKRYARSVVETTDLKEAVEEATGRDLEWFFSQWVYASGHPEFDISWSWDEGVSSVVLRVKQTQKTDKGVPVFRMPVDVEVMYARGRSDRHRIQVTEKEHIFHIQASRRPRCVLFDPEGWLLKTLTFRKEKEELIFQVRRAKSVVARLQACESLGKIFHDDEVVDVLARVLRRDAFHGVRAAAARALGDMASTRARDALLTGLRDRDPRVRSAVAGSLGRYRDGETVKALARFFRREKRYYPAGSALVALGRTRRNEAYEHLVSGLGRPSHNDIIERSVFLGLAELRDGRAIDLAKEHARYGHPTYVREAAVRCLGSLGYHLDRRREDVRETLSPYLKDADHRVRAACIEALVTLGDAAALEHLYTSMENDPIGLIRRSARRAVRRLRERDAERRAQRAELAKDIEEIKKTMRELQGDLKKLEGRIDALTKKRQRRRKKRRG